MNHQRRADEAIRKFQSATTDFEKEHARRELLALKSELEGQLAIDAIKKSHTRGAPLEKIGR